MSDRLEMNRVSPIARMTEVMRKRMPHDTTVGVAGLDRKDEIRAMASAGQVFKESIIGAERLATEQAAQSAEKLQ